LLSQINGYLLINWEAIELRKGKTLAVQELFIKE